MSGEQKLAQRETLIRPWLSAFMGQIDELVPQYLTGAGQSCYCLQVYRQHEQTPGS